MRCTPGTAGAQLGAELQERRRLAERIGAEPARLDDLVRDVAARATLAPLHEDAERDRRREKHGEADEGADEGHSIPG